MSQELEPSRNKGTVYMGKVQSHLPGQGGVPPHVKASGGGLWENHSWGWSIASVARKPKRCSQTWPRGLGILLMTDTQRVQVGGGERSRGGHGVCGADSAGVEGSLGFLST